MEESLPVRLNEDSFSSFSPESSSNFDITYIEDSSSKMHEQHFVHGEEFITQSCFRIHFHTENQLYPQASILSVTNYRLIIQKYATHVLHPNPQLHVSHKHQHIPYSLPYGYIQEFNLTEKEIKIELKNGLKCQIRPDVDKSHVYELILSQLVKIPFCTQYIIGKESAQVYDCLAEMERMRINEEHHIIVDNSKGSICPSYPKYFIIPKNVTQDLVEENAMIRNLSRVPVLCYYHHNCLSGIWRASKLKSGYAENHKYNNAYLQEIGSHLHLIDLKEDQFNKEYHYKFQTLANLQNIYQRLIVAYTKNQHLLKSLVKWYDDVDKIIHFGYEIATNLHAGKSILIQQNTGYDREAQISAIAQIIVDPFYRTIHGFGLLIEKEFVAFGHPFNQRLGFDHEKMEEMCPIFIQFLQCVHQLLSAYPESFEYSGAYLARIAYELFTTKYNNFLHSSCFEKMSFKHLNTSATIWKNLPAMKIYYNYQWKENIAKHDLLKIRKKPSIKEYLIWKEYLEIMSIMQAETPEIPNCIQTRKEIYKAIHRSNSIK